MVHLCVCVRWGVRERERQKECVGVECGAPMCKCVSKCVQERRETERERERARKSERENTSVREKKRCTWLRVEV